MRRAIAVVVVALFAAASCSKSPTGPAEVAAFGGLSDYVTGARLSGGAAPIAPGTGPAPSDSGGPTPAIAGPTAVAKKNASATFTLSSSTPFQRVYVTSAGKTGFILIDLPVPVTAQNVDVFFNTLPPSFTLGFQLATAAGAAGLSVSLLITAS